MAKSVDAMSSEPRLAKCWSRYRNNVPSCRNNEDCESCYQRAIRVPVMDALIIKSFQSPFGDDLSTNTTSIFRSKMKRWVKFCKTELRKH